MIIWKSISNHKATCNENQGHLLHLYRADVDNYQIIIRSSYHPIFIARSRTLDLKCNFKLGQSKLQCRLCDAHLEDQNSLLTCPAPSQQQQPQYSDIFSDNMTNF